MKTIFTLLTLILANTIYSQNLIVNPSFEEYTTCPNYVSQIKKATGWSAARLDEGSTDYFSTCSGNYYSSAPYNNPGYQEPRTGKAYAGFFVYYKWLPTTFLREYIQGQLKEPLVANKKYLVSFHVSLADAVYYNGWLSKNTAIHSMGAYLSNSAPNQENYTYKESDNDTPHNYGNIPLDPQIINTPQKFLSDTLGWTEIKGIYTAKGGEKYITIGNFKNDEDTDIKVIFPGDPSSYYYIDDVSVICIDDYCAVCDYTVNLGKDVSLCSGETLSLDASLEGATYLWQDGTEAATYFVSKSGLYWVDVLRNNCIRRDSIQVTYQEHSLNLGKDTTICPGKTLLLNATPAKGPFLWSNGSTQASLTISQEGTYWVQAFINGCPVVDTIQVSLESSFDAGLKKDTTICSDQSVILTVLAPGYTLFWSNHSTASSIEVSEEGWYWVEVKGRYCTSRDSIKVKHGDCQVFIPNIITPNGDKKNDSFFVKGINKDPWEIIIVNQWGKQVYANADYKNEWNGTTLPTGIYYYNLTNRRTKKAYKGWIQLLY